MCTPVEEFGRRQGGIGADFCNSDFHRTVIDTACTVGEVGYERYEFGARDVDESDDITEVHRHTDPDRVAARRVSTVVEVGAEDPGDVDSGVGVRLVGHVVAVVGHVVPFGHVVAVVTVFGHVVGIISRDGRGVVAVVVAAGCGEQCEDRKESDHCL